MVANRLGLLLDDDAALPDFEAAAARLRQLLPGIDTDRFAEAFPAVLDAGDFERALDVSRALGTGRGRAAGGPLPATAPRPRGCVPPAPFGLRPGRLPVAPARPPTRRLAASPGPAGR
jgi:hypothetical protein